MEQNQSWIAGKLTLIIFSSDLSEDIQTTSSVPSSLFS